jgi:hypothetical protein
MTNKKDVLGFGFIPDESEHHFLVLVSKSRTDPVMISEHLTWEPEQETKKLSLAPGQEDAKLKVILPRDKWDRVAEFVEADFNNRLRKHRNRTGKWKIGANPVARLFGKELTLLGWAIEDADPALIAPALNNWQGLQPEERWWLFTMTNAATGHAIHGRNKGWRKAVRFALTENPTSDHMPQPGLDLFELIRESATTPEAAKKPAAKKKAIYKQKRKRKNG